MDLNKVILTGRLTKALFHQTKVKKVCGIRVVKKHGSRKDSFHRIGNRSDRNDFQRMVTKRSKLPIFKRTRTGRQSI